MRDQAALMKLCEFHVWISRDGDHASSSLWWEELMW